MSPMGEQRVNFTKRMKRAVAVLTLAAALLFPALLEASVVVEGVPPWLRGPMERSARSVWEEIQSGGAPSGEESLRLLALVAARVFMGFRVQDVLLKRGVPHLRFAPSDGALPWEVEIIPPQLIAPADGWFWESLRGLGEEISATLEDLPVEALSWADVPLKRTVDDLFKPLLPGWNSSLLVRMEEERRILRISFVPQPPFVLAVVPRVTSDTLPVMLQSDLHETILKALAPVVGLPIEWVSFHKGKVEELAAGALKETNIVENSRSSVKVSFHPAQVAAADASIDSPKYSVRAWVAAYAGSDAKYPEIGLHFGRKFLPFSGWDMEAYGEWLLSANDFTLESRWGLRWSPWKNIMAGVERVFPGNVTWYRLWIDGGVKAPYLWWRVDEDGRHNLGAGYRINPRVSLEIHYDGRDEDKISIKALSDL